jgi:4-hydroxy-3-methylbut-2-enyl diphosphate reductase
MEVTVDPNAGFCFGVREAINQSEALLDAGEQLFCLGQMVHNESELKRLEDKGLKYISTKDFPKLRGQKVLFRAHGEPPETYDLARKYGVEIIDATCPIVLKLQERIRKQFETSGQSEDFFLFGKHNHPETIGLNGQTRNQLKVVTKLDDVEGLDLNRPVRLYSQTTMDPDIFRSIAEKLKAKAGTKIQVYAQNTICHEMKRRKPNLIEFVKRQDLVVFVAGSHSSNGRFFFSVAKENNPNTHFITSRDDIQSDWFQTSPERVGVSGATSTPQWLLWEVADYIRKNFG